VKGSLIALDQVGGRRAAARLIDGRLDDLLIDPLNDALPTPGTIFRAITDRPMKGQGGLMLRLPDKQRGFLRSAKVLGQGAPVLVQVTGYAEPGKAVPVTTKLLFKGRHAILTPGAPGINLSRKIRDEELRDRLLLAVCDIDLQGAGLILRSGAATADEHDIADETAQLADLAQAVLGDATGANPERLLDGSDAHELAWRDWGEPDQQDTAPGAFARHGIDDMIDALRAPLVELSGGATAWIEPTRALVAVDVNTAGDTSPAAGLKANIALARELPRQLRCRGLGGQITIDFAPLAKRDRRQVEQALQSAFRADAIETALVGWTPLGHFEMQRKRERQPFQ